MSEEVVPEVVSEPIEVVSEPEVVSEILLVSESIEVVPEVVCVSEIASITEVMEEITLESSVEKEAVSVATPVINTTRGFNFSRFFRR